MTRIAISPCRKLPDYETSVRQAGADAQVLDLSSAKAPALLDGIDGLVLTGGGDVDPSYYDQAPHPTFSPAEPGRDAAEIALAREAMARKLPILAICRGVQVLNVAAGGSLVQDIPSAATTALPHRVESAPAAPAHTVQVETGTALSRLLAAQLEDGSLVVNSRHHQAVDRVAPGFRVSAVAPDGVIEAIEQPDQPFCIGVQWHPENFWSSGEFKHLFTALVDAASEYSRRERADSD
jgi:putative glutamine amidotransferase